MLAFRRLPLLLLPLLPLLGACSGENSTPTRPITIGIITLSVSVGSSVLSLGETTKATLTARDGNGALIALTNVSWSSSNTAVATVDSTGLVTAVGSGSAIITAASGSLTSSALVSVDQPPSVPPLTISLAAPAIAVGQTTTAIAYVDGAAVDPSIVKWTSSVPTIATVSTAGVVTGVSPGTSKIGATYNGSTVVDPIVVQAP